jgi:hypothetical protein
MNDCHFLNSKATLKDVLKVLSLPGVHRVPMMGRGGLLNQKSKRPLNRFITQSDVVRGTGFFIWKHGNLLSEIFFEVLMSWIWIFFFFLRDLISTKLFSFGLLQAI